MISDDDIDYDQNEHSGDDLDDETHRKLVNNVLNLSYKQHVKKATRSEPALKISEYDLVKTAKNVHIPDLANVLQSKGKQLEISKKLKRIEQKTTTLPKPLEKPQAERIHRTVAYKKAQLDLDRWDPIVTSMRVAAHTTFPLDSGTKLKNDDMHADWGYKTDLQKSLAALEPKAEVFVMNNVDEPLPMSLEEMLEKRGEAAKMRAHESYKIAKARQQNKIKSKKYHRIQRKEKIKQQLKEFELLQKNNPEAALEKLEEIERARAEERMSLRHKSTGQWAKSKLIRAKYDKDSRQVLAQQLAISRELTAKLKKAGDSDDSEEEGKAEETKKQQSGDNPWLNGNIKVTKEVEDFISGYRKFWEEQNGIKGKDSKGQQTAATEENDKATKAAVVKNNKAENPTVTTENLPVAKKRVANGEKKLKKVKKVKKSTIYDASTGEWDVSEVRDADDIDVDKEFAKLDHKIREKVKEKYDAISKTITKKTQNSEEKTEGKGAKKLTNLEMLELPKQNLRPVIDEELDETAHRTKNKQKQDELKAYKKLNEKPVEKSNGIVDEIDPNKFIKMNPTKLNTAIPDLMAFEDNEEDENQRGVISEAFQDDDIVENFQKEKQNEIEASNPKDIDLSLPGWGCWGGKDIKQPASKKKRFIVKFPEKMPRKDKNKGDLIINETGNAKLRPHLVSEVPFPFKNVKDYEASIRAPIGNTFVPETAFRRLTKPAVTTKLGSVIEPMNEEVLIKKK